ncbi:MAG: ribonuclease R [Flavobacteriales bacterium]
MAKNNSHSSSKKLEQFLRKEILIHMTENSDRSFNYKQLAKAIGVDDNREKQMLMDILDDLREDGKLKEVDRGRYVIKQDRKYLTGTIEINSRGNGYLLSGQERIQDVFINKNDLNRSLNGDTVKVLLHPSRRDKQPEGEVVEIIQRSTDTFVGRVELSKNFAFLIPDSQRMHVDIFIPLEKLNGARHMDKAIVQLGDWPSHATNPFGKVIEVLGKAGENETEMHAILAEFGLPYHYPKEVENYANKLDPTISSAEVSKRRDFRSITTFTIDPEDAKDFDDALSIQFLREDKGKKIYEIGIHIADVSHYVVPESILDKEALNRATSVYLVDRVVPMLPEILSNQICSLRPNEDKLTFSVVFEIDEDANVRKEWFERTVIHSDRRFTYEEAQKIIEGNDGDLMDEIRIMDKMAKIIREKRMANGALGLESVEVKFRLDDKGKPIGVYTKVSRDANKLIEEFMLLANKAVAKYIGEPDGKKKIYPMIYRIHDEPKEEKLKELSTFVSLLGYKLKSYDSRRLPQAIAELLKDIKDPQVAETIQTYTIRSMAKAIYDVNNIGHYGLAFDYYTHFTSPIRRYPDLIVHRMLQHFLDGDKGPSKSQLELWCRHSSAQEKKASDAERASIKYKQVEYMKENIGKIFDGVVSGVAEWGIFVEVAESKCEGMISLRSIRDDMYVYDQKALCVRGTKTKKTFRLGTKVKIKVKGADMMKRQIDFELM